MSNDEPEISPEQAELQAYVEQVLDTFRDRFGFLHPNRPDPELGVLAASSASKLLGPGPRPGFFLKA